MRGKKSHHGLPFQTSLRHLVIPAPKPGSSLPISPIIASEPANATILS